MEDIAQLSGKGAITLPARIRRRLGLVEGDILSVRVSDGSIVLDPAVVTPVELYDEQRMKEFEDNARMTDEELRQARHVWEAGSSPEGA